MEHWTQASMDVRLLLRNTQSLYGQRTEAQAASQREVGKGQQVPPEKKQINKQLTNHIHYAPMRNLQSNQNDMNSNSQAPPGLEAYNNSIRALWASGQEHRNIAEGPVSQCEPAFWPKSQQPLLTDTVSLPLPEFNSNHSVQP